MKIAQSSKKTKNNWISVYSKFFGTHCTVPFPLIYLSKSVLTNIFVSKGYNGSQKPWRGCDYQRLLCGGVARIGSWWGLLNERLYQLHEREGEFTVDHGGDQELFYLLGVCWTEQVVTGTPKYQITVKKRMDCIVIFP